MVKIIKEDTSSSSRYCKRRNVYLTSGKEVNKRCGHRTETKIQDEFTLGINDCNN